MKKILSLWMIVFLLASPLYSDTDSDPVPWDRDSFPRWALDLRRYESILIGAIPFAMLFIDMGYNSFTDRTYYVPWVDGNNDLSNSEKEAYTKVSLSISVAALIAVTDLIIYKIKTIREGDNAD